jgi:hypothetical protein
LLSFMRLLQEQITPDETIALETITAEWDTLQAKQKPLSRKSGLPRYFTAFASIAAILVAGVALWIGLRPSAEPKSALSSQSTPVGAKSPFRGPHGRSAASPDHPHTAVPMMRVFRMTCWQGRWLD